MPVRETVFKFLALKFFLCDLGLLASIQDSSVCEVELIAIFLSNI